MHSEILSRRQKRIASRKENKENKSLRDAPELHERKNGRRAAQRGIQRLGASHLVEVYACFGIDAARRRCPRPSNQQYPPLHLLPRPLRP